MREPKRPWIHLLLADMVMPEMTVKDIRTNMILFRNEILRKAHMQYYPVSNTGEITNETFSFYWQAMRHLKSADYLEAVNDSSMQTWNDFPMWFVLAGSFFEFSS